MIPICITAATNQWNKLRFGKFSVAYSSSCHYFQKTHVGRVREQILVDRILELRANMLTLRSWILRVTDWFQQNEARRPRWRADRLRSLNDSRFGAMILRVETLESRRLLTSLVAVNVHDNTINLTDIGGWKPSSGDDVSISYTSTQVTLTGNNGTMFQVGNQKLSTYTVNITGPATIKMRFGWGSNDVSITGDGTSSLAAVDARLGFGLWQDNSLTLTKVVADSLNVQGGWSDDSVKLDHSTINSNLNARLGFSSGDQLDLESTTVKGNVTDIASQVTINQSTINGKLRDIELGKDSTFTSTDSTYGGDVKVTMGRDATLSSAHSTYTGDVSVRMGRDGDVELIGSPNGTNIFKGQVSFDGVRHHEITVNQHQNSVDPVSTQFTYKHATNNTSNVTISNPTVLSQSVPTTTPTITGTYDSVHGPNLFVTVNGKTFKLGTDSQLTSPSTGKWALDLTGNPLTTQTTTVTVSSSDAAGNFASGTGTITSEQFIINKFLTANNLTATKTSTGLDYVIVTNGNGAIPTNGQKVTVNYTGYILKADGTQGTKFDSNTDPQFNHVSPFQFTLGTGAVIKGWDQAFALLPVGTTVRLFTPSALAYGTQGSGSSIPPNSILIFDVTVVSVV